VKRGIVFFGSGKKYVEQAVAAAKRSAKWNDVPHLIYCSERPDEPGDFIVKTFSPTQHIWLDRIACLITAPFDQVIYLDADCGVVANITELFDILDEYEIAAAHAPGYRRYDDPDVPSAFYELNCGVLVFRTSPVIFDLLKSWHACYRQWLRTPAFAGCVPSDQPSFRHVTWTRKVPLYVLGPEYNWRPWMNSFLCEKVKIIHAYSDDYEGLAQQANDSEGARIFPPLDKAREFLG
jgi:hypothetical protein